MVQQLSEEDIAELRDVFNMVDKDGSGSISQEEIKYLMDLLGMEVDGDAVEAMFHEVDKDGSGTVEFEEFLQVMTIPKQFPYGARDVARAFKLLGGSEATGKIQRDVLGEALVKYLGSRVSGDEVWRSVNSLKTDPHGNLDYGQRIKLFLGL